MWENEHEVRILQAEITQLEAIMKDKDATDYCRRLAFVEACEKSEVLNNYRKTGLVVYDTNHLVGLRRVLL